jgi:RHH-type rel operon transcriptional repressor/antitoxin RelB
MSKLMFGIRLEPELDRRLTALARKQGKTKSDLAREAIRRFLLENDLVAEARRQSLLVSRDKNEQDALDLIENASDFDRWR